MKETGIFSFGRFGKEQKNGNSIRTLMESTAGNSWKVHPSGWSGLNLRGQLPISQRIRVIGSHRICHEKRKRIF